VDWKILLDQQVKKYLQAHQDDDVAMLALKSPPSPAPARALILDQVKARQKAKVKIPGWATNSGIVFPASTVIEQASSAATAKYKAGLVKGDTFVDLTGGAGVDTVALSENFSSGFCVERDETAVQLLAYNIPLFTKKPIKILHAHAENFVGSMPRVNCIYIDPQRRDDAKKGLYILQECSPDITALLPALKEKAGCVLIKTSPMLDISKALEILGGAVEAHIVEWRGECREVLYLLDFTKNIRMHDIPIKAIEINDDGKPICQFTFTQKEEREAQASFSQPLKFLYEPGPAFQKAGAFNLLGKKYGVRKLHEHTHLYTSEKYVADFPGRRFEIQAVLPIDKKALPFDQANLTLRNFPGDVATLRRQLKLKEGGEEYLFACTLQEGIRVLIHTRKPSGK
jgi:hypothetical protein